MWTGGSGGAERRLERSRKSRRWGRKLGGPQEGTASPERPRLVRQCAADAPGGRRRAGRPSRLPRGGGGLRANEASPFTDGMSRPRNWWSACRRPSSGCYYARGASGAHGHSTGDRARMVGWRGARRTPDEEPRRDTHRHYLAWIQLSVPCTMRIAASSATSSASHSLEPVPGAGASQSGQPRLRN
jgi:hypothetical protein